MRKVEKYELAMTDWQFWTMPEGAEILCAQVQEDKAYVWVLGDTEKPVEVRWLRMWGTEHEIPDNEELKYIGSFQRWDGGLMYHLFEGRGDSPVQKYS